MPETLFRLDNLIQRNGRELRIVQCQKAFENGNGILSEHPLVRHVRQFQRRLYSVFRCLEAVDRLVSVTVLLEKPRHVHSAHQFIKQMPVPMTIPTGDEGKVGQQ